jgi:Carlavirus putative nucleic acid binding protein
MDEILAVLQKRFPPFPQNILLKLYRVRSERLRMLMRKGIPEDIRWIIEGKVREDEQLPVSHLPGTGRSTYAKKRRAKRLGSNCHKCARWTCDGKCRSIGIPSTNRNDKIEFIKDGLRKENLDEIQISLETHPSGAVQIEMLDLWQQFQREWQHLGKLRLKDPVCQLTRKFYGKRILDS